MSPSPWQLLVVLLIVLVIFGTKKLRNVGSDLGGAVKGFRSAMNEAEQTTEQIAEAPDQQDADFDTTPTEETRKDG